MTKRTVSVVVLIAFIPQLTGCMTWQEEEDVPREEFWGTLPLDPEKTRITGVTKTDGERVEFVPGEWPARVEGDTIHATTEDGPYEVAVADVERVWIQSGETDVAKSVGAVIGVAAGVAVAVFLIALATKESCPFIYSWDGERWVFDAEPYGGATTKGLERADFSELESLVAVDGEYRLRITNEVAETQYTNLLELWAVHHPPGTRVVADEFGALYAMRNPVPLASAVDATGRDLRPWLDATDDRIWEHEPVPTATGELRQEIVLTFPKPKNATRARLIANVATGGWGSHMIRELYAMRGTSLDAFYDALDTSATARQDLFAWNLREELYTLQVRVEEPTGWEVRGLLPGGGPFISEHRVVPLDVSRVEGSEVRIRLRPPVGFWGLNSFRMDFGPTEPVQVEKRALTLARTSEGEDVRARLAAVDDAYYAMPETGDWAELRFPAVDAPEGMEQTFILSSRGYYRLHLEADRAPDMAAIREMETVPGAAVRLAVESYRAARAAAAAADGGSEARR